MAELIDALKATGATLAFDAIGGGRLATGSKYVIIPNRAA